MSGGGRVKLVVGMVHKLNHIKEQPFKIICCLFEQLLHDPSFKSLGAAKTITRQVMLGWDLIFMMF